MSVLSNRKDISEVKFQTKEKVICKLCHGEGLIRVFKYFSHTEGEINEIQKCPDCLGKRVLVRVLTETFERVG